ncbi:MAG: hypothetical protein KO206_08860 [Methanomicrobiaceae archaeon]|nr:hypothetical protein [Methanomicrobiaceae archaeon]MDD5418421.1 NifB/NifX family molybdenum-iron cluster-binding protein [Methanomicrobiaceae archaeon]
MRFAVASMEKGGPDDIVAPAFETSPTITIADAYDDTVRFGEILVPEPMGRAGIAGSELAQDLIARGVRIAIAGSFAPDVLDTFAREGVMTIQARETTVQEAVHRALCGGPPGRGRHPPPPEESGRDVHRQGRGGRGERGSGWELGSGGEAEGRMSCPECGCTLSGRRTGARCPVCGAEMVED